jgi:DNA excision repair protein ERCC-2
VEIIMSVDEQISDWFPYGKYRPHQQNMLRATFDAVSQGKTLLINAPTGSGKSSTVSAVLAATEVRPVIVAVRTVSQLNIFVRELQMIREKKQPGLKFCYIVGKGKVCRQFGEMGVNERCKIIKKASIEMIKEKSRQMQLGDGRVVAYSQNCPWYVNSKRLDEDTGLIQDSEEMCAKAEGFVTTLIEPDEVVNFAGDICPYELMRRGAFDSDVVIVNYQHVLNPAIRQSLLGKFYRGDDLPVLVIDEAHNVGSSLEELHSIQIDGKILDRGYDEHNNPEVRMYLGEEYNSGKDKVLPEFILWMKDFVQAQDAKFKREEIFEYDMVWKKMQECITWDGCTPVEFLDGVYHSLVDYQAAYENKVRSMGMDDGCNNLIKVTGFLLMLAQSMKGDDGNEDRSIVKVFVKNDRGSALKLRNIDPSEDAIDLMESHSAMVLMSGTLHPPAVYGKYLFGDESANKLAFLSLPNVFPQENRKLVVCVDATSAYKAVTAKNGDNDNNRNFYSYMNEFVRIPGNLAIYFPSYSMLREYEWKLKNGQYGKLRKFYAEPQNSREATAMLEEYLALPERGESGVLMAVSGGKLSEGIDYRGDAMVGVMVVGLPLAAYSPVMQSIIKYYEKKFGSVGNFIAYTLPALNRAQQALGRVIRTETDRGFLVLCERRYLDNMKSLPDWMRKEAERCVVEEFSELVEVWNNG